MMAQLEKKNIYLIRQFTLGFIDVGAKYIPLHKNSRHTPTVLDPHGQSMLLKKNSSQTYPLGSVSAANTRDRTQDIMLEIANIALR